MLDIISMRNASTEVVEVLKTIGNPDRLLILCQLTQDDLCVKDLENKLDIKQPTLSQQLGVLRSQGVVNTERRGKYIYYSIADKKLLNILELLYKLYCPVTS